MTDAPLLRSYIAGAWRDGHRVVPDIDPAHPDRIVASASQADAAMAGEAVAPAAAALPQWRATPAPPRREILRRAADLLAQRAEDIPRGLPPQEGETPAHAPRAEP